MKLKVIFPSSLLTVPVWHDPCVICCNTELSTLIANPQYFIVGLCGHPGGKRWMGTHNMLTQLLSCISRILARAVLLEIKDG